MEEDFICKEVLSFSVALCVAYIVSRFIVFDWTAFAGALFTITPSYSLSKECAPLKAIPWISKKFQSHKQKQCIKPCAA